MTIIGIGLGVVALTAMIGLTASSSATISGEFDALKATRIEVLGVDDFDTFDTSIGEAGLARTAELNGVVAVGAFARIEDVVPFEVGTINPRLTVPSDEARPEVYALVGDVLAAERSVLRAGRMLDQGHNDRADRVVLIGDLVASRLNLTGNGREMIYIGTDRFQVLGVVGSRDDSSPLPLSVMVPYRTATTLEMGQVTAPVITIRTDLGAAEVIGDQAAIALDPSNPDRLSVAVPPSPERLRGAIEEQTQAQLLALASVSIVVGAIGVSNTTMVGVLERTHEIGVRRAVGARSRDIIAQFLMESALLGAIGGLVGMTVGVVVVLIVAVLNSWTAVMPTWVFGLGPLLGLSVGLVAGGYPAWRASRIEPMTALAS